MTKVIFILSSISSGLKFWSVNHTLKSEISELKVFKNIKAFSEISNNCTNDLFEINVYTRMLNLAADHCW